MELNLIGTLTMIKTMGMLPNFSELARTFKKDRHTIKKMYDGKEKKERKKRKHQAKRHVGAYCKRQPNAPNGTFS